MLKAVDVYKKMPKGVKDTIKFCYSFIPLKLRLGSDFYDQLSFLEKSQWWSRKELENYQNEQLKRLIEHAFNNVPYYNRLFKSLRLTPQDIEKQEDLRKIPILTKDIIRKNTQELRAINFNDKSVIKLSTSGSTGEPLNVLYDKKREYLNYDPYVWRFFGWAGLTVGGLYAKMSNLVLPSGIIYSYNPVRNLLILNPFALNIDKIDEYYKGLKQYGIQYLAGYPNSIAYMTKLFKSRGLQRTSNFKGIFCHSEYLYDWQRKLIEEFWGCQCFNLYGLDERVVLGVECKYHKIMHLCSDFGITEFVKNPENSLKKIIATSLTNYAMPLIRYDTEDVGILIDHECGCGRGFPLFCLQGGKGRSFAIGKDGSRIPVLHFGIPKATDNVLQFQFIQNAPGILNLNIVKGPKFRDVDLNQIMVSIRENLGGNMIIKSHFVDKVETTQNGKTEIFRQKISN